MNIQPMLVNQLQAIGVAPGDALMVHASYKSLGIADPEQMIQALIAVLGDSGTLFMPALSYQQNPHHIFDVRKTPACVGYLPEYFRCRSGTMRSVHPTHSVSGLGRLAPVWLEDHIHDTTPCGPHSPFHKLLHHRGKILMLGCGLQPNTTMHAIEEDVQPPYLFDTPREYIITDVKGNTFTKKYIPHNFHNPHAIQRYERVEGLLSQEGMSVATVGKAKSHLIWAEKLYQVALFQLRNHPFYFVDIIEEER